MIKGKRGPTLGREFRLSCKESKVREEPRSRCVETQILKAGLL